MQNYQPTDRKREYQLREAKRHLQQASNKRARLHWAREVARLEKQHEPV